MSHSSSIYYIRQYQDEQYHHGGIGYTDAERIMEKLGFTPIILPAQRSFSPFSKIKRLAFLSRTLRTIPVDATVVFVYPAYARLVRWLIKRLARKVKLVCIVGDIDGIKDADEMLLQAEIKELKSYDALIVHNESMRAWVEKNIGSKPISTIDFFDFLAPVSSVVHQPSNQIVFAGNLVKSSFIEQLDHVNDNGTIQFNVYGPGISEKALTQKSLNYIGIIDPYELPAKLEGAYGLLWDGPSIDEPAGSLGDYMQYISHHKLSLYILAGLPLIVPAKAASAALIRQYDIGLIIDSLHDIAKVIATVNEEKYQQMQLNLKSIAEKISAGKCLAGALEQLAIISS